MRLGCAVAAWLALSACHMPFETAGGGGSQTGNGTTLTGVVIDGNGRGAAGARVELYPAKFNPALDSSGPAYATGVDGAGHYSLRVRRSGRYKLYAWDEASGSNALVSGIVIGAGDGSKGAAKEGENADTAFLRMPGSVGIPLSAGNQGLGDGFFVEGTGLLKRIDSRALELGRAVLTGVPVGKSPRLLYLRKGTNTATLVAESLQIAPGRETVAERYWAWTQIRSYRVRTDRGGLASGDTLRAFPILLRLDHADFDFSSARSDGSDLRITRGPQGADMPYAIERWDSAGGKAEIWIKTDTLIGGANLDLAAHSGNPTASAPMAVPAVFDTAAGFAGVWHLSGTGPQYRDGTAHGYHGAAAAAPAPDEGAIGAAQAFADTGHAISVTRAAGLDFGTGDFTASAWIKTPAPGAGKTRQILCKRDTLVGNYELQLQPDNRLRAYLRGGNVKDTLTSANPVSADAWHLLAVRRRSGQLALSLDGSEEFSPLTDTLDVSSPADLVFGVDGYSRAKGDDAEWFLGSIDEVVIAGRARSAAWLRFAWRNQAPGSDVVESLP